MKKLSEKSFSIFWFRRDLRVEDNAGFYHALKAGDPVLPVFIFDTEILSKLENKADTRVSFIYDEITRIKTALEHHGSSLLVLHGKPVDCFEKLMENTGLKGVYANTDYEPYATGRDEKIEKLLSKSGRFFKRYKDQVIFEKEEVVKEDGMPYTVFTPYKRKWLSLLDDFYLESYPTTKYFGQLLKADPIAMPKLSDLGFKKGTQEIPERKIDKSVVGKYDKTRDFPGTEGTSKLGIHLRFGTISIRGAMRIAKDENATWLSELIWREFYQMILWHFPETVTKSFKPAYDHIKWRDSEKDFEKWCRGETGYPIVDAGMRELNATGFMHNRVRMITASFLTKHLLIDWRWGEHYFAEKLLDYEQASNIGNWQWAAGSGCDAVPYFRVFNPSLQTEKFDPKHQYIKKWVPDYQELTYPQPMVDHAEARDRALSTYKSALNNK